MTSHTIDDLVRIASDHYASSLPDGGPGGSKSPEDLRRAEAHARACAWFPAWVAMLRRLEARFTDRRVENRSIFRQSPGATVYDLSYSGSVELPPGAGESYRYVGFLVSIVVPYYIIYRLRRVDGQEGTSGRTEVSFDLAEDEKPVSRAIEQEIRATFEEHAPMPPDVGEVIVPGARTPAKCPGESRIFDCLFSDDW